MNHTQAFNTGRRWASMHADEDGGTDCPIRAAARAKFAAKHGEEFARVWSEGVSFENWGPPKYDENGRVIRYRAFWSEEQ